VGKDKRPAAFAVGKVRVRVHSGPREDGRWRWRADRATGVVAGKERREAVWSGWGTREEAEQAVIDRLAEKGERFVGASDIRTVYDVLDVWIADYEPRCRSPRTARHRRYCAERLGKSELGSVLIGQIGRRAIERYRDQAMTTGAASTTREDMVTLRMAWSWARERGYVPDLDIPTVEVRVRRQDAVYGRYTPRLEEIARVLADLKVRSPSAYRAARLLFATGARRHEIARLRWDQVDLVRGVVQIGEDTKTGGREVALHPDVVAELRTWERDGELVHGASVHAGEGSLNNRIRAACKALGLPVWSAKGLRQAAVRQLYRTGSDPGVAGAQLGHSPKVALKHYDEVRAEDLAVAVARAGLGVLPAIPPPEAEGKVIDMAQWRRK
jgi:integrase